MFCCKFARCGQMRANGNCTCPTHAVTCGWMMVRRSPKHYRCMVRLQNSYSMLFMFGWKFARCGQMREYRNCTSPTHALTCGWMMVRQSLNHTRCLQRLSNIYSLLFEFGWKIARCGQMRANGNCTCPTHAVTCGWMMVRQSLNHSR